MNSCFVLIGTRQHAVAILNGPARMAAQIDYTMTHSLYHVSYFVLTCHPKHACHITCFRVQGAQSGTMVSRKETCRQSHSDETQPCWCLAKSIFSRSQISPCSLGADHFTSERGGWVIFEKKNPASAYA